MGLISCINYMFREPPNGADLPGPRPLVPGRGAAGGVWEAAVEALVGAPVLSRPSLWRWGHQVPHLDLQLSHSQYVRKYHNVMFYNICVLLYI